MSTIAINTVSSTTLRASNPSGTLTRRGRLARFLVVLSLSIAMVASFALKAGAGDVAGPSAAGSYVVLTVAPGDSIWSIATAMADGSDVRAMVDEIITVNSLGAGDLLAGQKIRIPLR
ncbi:unannotated protein [freshwater metagenome]|uniref:Unannotated protein n=1 Tax=freshwater metagenome TaxID=449393 RepID=A0A6J7XSV1_9ZZZZ